MTSPASEIVEEYHAYGAVARLFRASDRGEVLLAGAAGTGKTRGLLEYANYVATEYRGARILLVRKTRRSLTESAMVTLEQKVLSPAQGVAWQAGLQRYHYPNGSIIAVAGMDKASKVMSSEWDLIVVPEATELDEREWEALTTRLRNGRVPYQQIVGDCNPDAPTHWLKLRAESGKLLMLDSRHEDNPTVTPDYLRRLDELTGVRYLRYRLGVWAAAEGMVYQDAWERGRNLVERERVTRRTYNPLYGDCALPRDWPRYMAIDFGYTNPFVAQWWAVDPDGRVYLYREIYRSQTLVEDHARAILHYAKWHLDNGRLAPTMKDSDPLPRAIFADHDAEGRATLERHLGWYTTSAEKAISDGIQAVAARMKPAGDGLPRLYVLQGSLVERDPVLAEQKLPCSTVEEIDGYVWDVRGGRSRGEEPMDLNNHGCDAMRYLCATLDRRPTQTSQTAFKVF